MSAASAGHLQTVLEAGKGNALQACVATLLGVRRMEDVPDFVKEKGSAYMEALDEFLDNNFPKLALVKVDLVEEKLKFRVATGTRCLLAGKSPRGDHKHVVIATIASDGVSFHFLHDPHPNGGNLDLPLAWAGFLCCK